MTVETMNRPADPGVAAAEEPLLATIGDALARLRFGTISVTVHEGRAVQLDITEKRRFGH